MKSSRPYIIRAIYDWIVDNDLTPHLLVDATRRDVMVPESYVSEGQIVLNISPTAVVGLQLGNDAIVFNGRFGGRPFDIYVTIGAVLGIYARENGQGMVFEPEPELEPEPPQTPESKGPTSNPERGRPSLKVVK